MTKKEFLEFYYAKKYLKENDSLIALTEIRSKMYDGRIKVSPLEEDKWLPKYDDLKDEFDILQKELKEVYDEANKQKEIRDRIIKSCKHEVRREAPEAYGFGYSTFYYCVFCGKRISKNHVWKDSININNHAVNLLADMYYDADGYPCKVDGGYSLEEVYNIIKQIVSNLQDDETIDFIKEFTKLNLENCTITDKKDKPEYYMMIIAGNNQEKIEDFNLFKSNNLKALDFFKYFSNILNCKILYIDNNINDEIWKIEKENYNGIEIKKYTSIKDLEYILEEYQQIPFNLIINLSELSTYEITQNKLERVNYNLDLQKKFPNALVYDFKEEKKELENDSHVITYSLFDKKYHILEDDKYITQDIEGTCQKLKRELKK